MDLLKSIKSSNASASNRTEYSLTEIVGIMNLINEGVKIGDIAALTGRSVHSLRYKFFEKSALKGKDKPRSIQQYESIEQLYEAHGAAYSEEDLQRRVSEFQTKLQQKIEG